MFKHLALAALIAAPATLAAHPHVFVETEVEAVFDDSGQFLGVRLSWLYDDFFSFLLTEDLGIDADGDMILNADEQKILTDAVLEWPADFGGDLHVFQNNRPLELAERREASVTYSEGRITETHFRPVAAPPDADVPVVVQVYDPYYYVAYEIMSPVAIDGGEDCTADLQKADLNAAYSLVDELLYGRPASDVGPDEEFPEVGHAFSDTVTVSCNASS